LVDVYLILATAMGAPPPYVPDAVPHAVAVTVAASDIAKVHLEDQPFQRYLFNEDQNELWSRVWQLHMNLLSRESETARVTVMRPYLWRIDLRDMRWDPGVYENALNQDVYFHRKVVLEKDTTITLYYPGGDAGKEHGEGKRFKRQEYTESHKKGDVVVVHQPHLPLLELDALRKATYSEVPILRSDWLFAFSARQRSILNEDNHGLGYYDFLQLPDRAAYIKLIDLDVKDPKEQSPFGREFRSALEKSGVSQQNRQIVRFPARGGGAWVTLDVATQRDRGIALDNLRPGEFDHKAEEWYGPLPNGGPVVFTSNEKGVRANVVPGDLFGIHDTSASNEARSAVIHPIVSCNGCHAGKVLRDFKDDVRKANRPGTWLAFGTAGKKSVSSRELALEFKRLYFSDVYKVLADDQVKFQEAIQRHTRLDEADPTDKGLTAEVAMRAYARAFHAYATDDVDVDRAARELGVKTSVWLAALRWYAAPGPGSEDEKPSEVKRLASVPLSRYLMKEPLPLSRLTSWRGTVCTWRS
jgi:hypothetical protein